MELFHSTSEQPICSSVSGGPDRAVVIKKEKHANLPLCPRPLFIESLPSAVFVEAGRLPKACRFLPYGPDSWLSTSRWILVSVQRPFSRERTAEKWRRGMRLLNSLLLVRILSPRDG